MVPACLAKELNISHKGLKVLPERFGLTCSRLKSLQLTSLQLRSLPATCLKLMHCHFHPAEWPCSQQSRIALASFQQWNVWPEAQIPMILECVGTVSRLASRWRLHDLCISVSPSQIWGRLSEKVLDNLEHDMSDSCDIAEKRDFPSVRSVLTAQVQCFVRLTVCVAVPLNWRPQGGHFTVPLGFALEGFALKPYFHDGSGLKLSCWVSQSQRIMRCRCSVRRVSGIFWEGLGWRSCLAGSI